ncbi:MAG: hypothetical protein AAGE52_25700 [Myxococcota bacterium]
MTKLERLFAEIDETPYGPAERALVEQAIEVAREQGDERLEFQAMMRLTNSAKMVGESATSLRSLQWCLERHLADPERFAFRIDENIDLAWQLKWLPGFLVATPDSSADVIAASIESMETFFETHALGLSAVRTARFRTAWAMGWIDDAERWRVKLRDTPRDAYSHCDACIRSETAAFLFATDRRGEGLKVTDELLARRFDCADEPQLASARALFPMLQEGRSSDARRAHLRSYEAARAASTHLRAIASHVEFCALTGSYDRGLLLLERHLTWVVADRYDMALQLRMMRAVTLFLMALAKVGRGGHVVAEAKTLEPLLGPVPDATASALLAQTRRWIEEAATRFDKRNGTSVQREFVDAVDDLVDKSYPRAVAPEVTYEQEQANPPTGYSNSRG